MFQRVTELAFKLRASATRLLQFLVPQSFAPQSLAPGLGLFVSGVKNFLALPYRKHALGALLALLVGALVWFARSPGIEGGVASADPLATAALAVVEPTGSGLGGGGLWLLHDVKNDNDVMLDGREKAPLAATRDMYLDDNGEIVAGLSIDGALAAGIPGEPAALAWLAENYGTLPLSTLLAPAIRLAEQGFPVKERYRKRAEFRRDALNASKAAADIFLRNGEAPPENEIIVQHDLAATLKTLAAAGHDGFYRGEVAQKLIDGVRAAGGLWTLEDLAAYEVKLREPVTMHYRDMKITTAALPSSGGLVMALALNILAGYAVDVGGESGATPNFVHLAVEAMRRAYRDRAQYMGDADFVEVPTAMILDPRYADGQRQSIRLDRATASASLAPTAKASPTEKNGQPQNEGTDTTHFSIIDAAGNRVAATLSVNYPFGSGLVAPGTGVLLNDEMDDFSAKPGVPNVYGLVGAEANAIVGGKRMLSSMSPSFFEDGERVAVLGTPGGSRIISMLLLAALEFHRGGGAVEIVNLPRFHHQYLPDSIQFEPGALSEQTIAALRARGHEMNPKERTWGNMHAVIRDRASGRVTAASDSRGGGAAVVLE